MKDLDDMTSEERWEWARRQWEESRRRFAGQPVPRISRAKRTEAADSYGLPYVFRVARGLRTRIVNQKSGGTADSRVRGMREVADGGPDALLLELDSGEVWAIRRADKPGPWDPDPETFAVVVEKPDVPVTAWRVDAAALTDERATVAAPGRHETWTVRTTSLGVE